MSKIQFRPIRVSLHDYNSSNITLVARRILSGENGHRARIPGRLDRNVYFHSNTGVCTFWHRKCTVIGDDGELATVAIIVAEARICGPSDADVKVFGEDVIYDGWHHKPEYVICHIVSNITKMRFNRWVE